MFINGINSNNTPSHIESPAFDKSNGSFMDALEEKLNEESVGQFSLGDVKPGEELRFKEQLFSEGAFFNVQGVDNLVV